MGGGLCPSSRSWRWSARTWAWRARSERGGSCGGGGEADRWAWPAPRALKWREGRADARDPLVSDPGATDGHGTSHRQAGPTTRWLSGGADADAGLMGLKAERKGRKRRRGAGLLPFLFFYFYFLDNSFPISFLIQTQVNFTN
jgi:hypothetical protein